ncbi:MAG: hypothetical protein ACMUHB_05765 [Thermoplasmatota archaeon]
MKGSKARISIILIMLFLGLLITSGTVNAGDFKEGYDLQGKATIILMGIVFAIINTIGELYLVFSYMPLKGGRSREKGKGDHRVIYSTLGDLPKTFHTIPFLFFAFGMIAIFAAAGILVFERPDYLPIFFFMVQAGLLFVFVPSAHFREGFEIGMDHITRPVTILNWIMARERVWFEDLVEAWVGDDSLSIRDRFGNHESYDFDKRDSRTLDDVFRHIISRAPGSCRVIDTRGSRDFNRDDLDPLKMPTMSKEETKASVDLVKGKGRFPSRAVFISGVPFAVFPFLSLYFGFDPTLVWISIIAATKLFFLSFFINLQWTLDSHEAERIIEWALVQQKKRKIITLPLSESEARVLIEKRLDARKANGEHGYSLARDRKFDIGISIFIGVGFILILFLSFLSGFVVYRADYSIEWALGSVAVVLVILTMMLFFVSWIIGRARRDQMLNKDRILFFKRKSR